MIHQVRVIFGDTDKMGVVYYANYLRWFEAARAALLRAHGLSGRDLDDLGVGFPVAEAHCRYRRPALYEDVVDIDIQVAELGGARVRFEYVLRRGDDLVAEGYTVHACVDGAGRPCRIPARIRGAFSQPVEASPGSI